MFHRCFIRILNWILNCDVLRSFFVLRSFKKTWPVTYVFFLLFLSYSVVRLWNVCLKRSHIDPTQSDWGINAAIMLGLMRSFHLLTSIITYMLLNKTKNRCVIWIIRQHIRNLSLTFLKLPTSCKENINEWLQKSILSKLIIG